MRIPFLRSVLSGLVIGVASMTPGISGGVLAAAFGLYEPVIHAIVNLRREFRKGVKFLFPLAVGVAIGIVLFSAVMGRLIDVASVSIVYAFIGLVAGNVPFLYKEATRDGFRPNHLWALAIAFGAVVLFEAAAGLSSTVYLGHLGFLDSLVCGLVLAVGTIVPGISSSLMLMRLGAYEGLLAALTGMDFSILLPLGIGFLAAALPLVKLVDVLFEKHRGPSYFGVVGFLAGSIVVSFPGLRSGYAFLGDIGCLLGGIALSVLATRLGRGASQIANPDS